MNWRPAEFYTLSWTSPEAETRWKGELQGYANLVLELEYLTVAQEMRDAALVFIQQAKIVDFFREMRKLGLSCIPIESSKGPIRVAVAKHEETLDLLTTAWGKDDLTVGRLLGFPDCCTKFFTDLWNVQQKVDTCLAMDDGEPYWATNNILLRNLGVRPVFHLPCSFHCEATKNVARQILHAAGDKWGVGARGFGKIYDVLNWPVRYSALHGVAEITTPVFRIRRETDYTAQERVVRYPGPYYPEHGARGIKFPFSNTPAPFVRVEVKDTWSANGFGSREDMHRAHQVLLDALEGIVDRSRSESVVDLGCGNGTLLRKIAETFPNVEVTGIDQDTASLQEARQIMPTGHFLLADVTGMEFNQTYDIGLISINRIEEAKRSGNEHFLAHLRRWFKTLVVYNYDVNPAKVEAVYHGELNSASGGPSSPAAEGGSDHRGNEVHQYADEDREHDPDGGGAERLVSDRPHEGREDSDER